ncbi:tRNA (adenosine(37)-N6)-dimethylallyltransferase MiaA [Conexibacter sp. SYSU D00693]|uniref:tRNA (adenosine(37)-N6)-dimethylallyltransferase MiaA n=1 Tax=Conexibacter sp. SYSU D00693 TaxID=2812560 RepID=UPI001F11A57A|nr:tRNA (adenosine(37)-N6)-dimethylallyltransferase MiaA [Conexibacter sp. SYSU D00693]
MAAAGLCEAPAVADVLAIFGPTGIGKTALAIALGERLRAQGERPVAVSADALQVYRGLEVLTGVASAEEQARLEHRLVSFLAVTETFSVAEYARRAHAAIDAVLDEGGTPIVVGGTGLYLRAALAELDLRPPPPPELRERLKRELDAHGPEVLHARLDDAARARVDPRDAHRIIRALELAELGQELHSGDQLWTAHTRRPTRLVGLTMDREALRERIAARVHQMVADGAAGEVRAAEAAGASETARKALGFRELLDGDVEAMVTATRRYARRQTTWMRKLEGVELVDVTGHSAEDVAAQLLP